MKRKVFISTYPFGLHNPEPLDLLKHPDIEIQINPYTRKLQPQELKELAWDCDVLIAGTENLTPLIQSSTKLKMISRVGIGLDSVPLQLCRQKGIIVTYTPDAVTAAVAELSVEFMLTLLRKTFLADRDIRNGQWNRYVGKGIGESMIGIIGMGRVGSQVISLLSSFRPKKILVYDIVDKTEIIRSFQQESGLAIVHASVEEIYQQADIVSLHIPHTYLTENMINQDTLKLFHPNSHLVNTSRGKIIHEQSLYQALANKQIMAAALDVYVQEPYNGPLTKLDNILLTAHMGSCSFDCRLKMETQASEDAMNFLIGKPLQREVPELEYEIENHFY